MLLALITLTAGAQQVFTARAYTDDGKTFHILKEPREFHLNREGERLSLNIVVNKQIVLETYITDHRVVREQTSPEGTEIVKTYVINVIDKKDGVSRYRYLVTTITDMKSGVIQSFIVTSIIKNVSKRAYLGKTN